MANTSTTKTIYGIYIIESLRGGELKDGEYLNKILKLSKIKSRYKWAKNREDFKELLKGFVKSGFRYLHLSCHSDETGIEINREEISNEELEIYLNNDLKNRRIFMSTCRGANKDLAARLICKCGALSLIGTPADLHFHKSALFWPPFYYTMNELDEHKMSSENLKKTLQTYVDLFKISINYYSRIESDLNKIRRIKVRYGEGLNNHVLNAL